MRRIWITGSESINDREQILVALMGVLHNGDFVKCNSLNGSSSISQEICDFLRFEKQFILVESSKPNFFLQSNLNFNALYSLNKQEIQWASDIIVFWDGEDQLSKHAIYVARQYPEKNLFLFILN